MFTYVHSTSILYKELPGLGSNGTKDPKVPRFQDSKISIINATSTSAVMAACFTSYIKCKC